MRTIKNLIGAFLIAIATFLVWVLILPDYDRQSFLKLTVQSRTTDLEARNKLINRVGELDKEYQSRYAELKRLSLVIPPEKHIDEMITILEEIFTKTGIPLTDMSLSAQEGQSDPNFNLIGMEFSFKANYNSIINFLEAVEKSLRLIDTTRLDVGIDKTEYTGTGIVPLGVTFEASAYYVKEEKKAEGAAVRASEE